MDGNKYQELAARTINQNLDDYDIELHALHGMVGEIGEIHSMYQKVYQGHRLDRQHLILEAGDLLWFIVEWATVNNITLNEIMEKNIDKLLKRYPNGFDAEHSLHRKKGDI